VSLKALLALGLLLTPAGGWHRAVPHRRSAHFMAGAAVADFSPPLRGQAPGGDPADCNHSSLFNAPREFAFEEPYIAAGSPNEYSFGDLFAACDSSLRWEGNLLGGGSSTPRFYTHVADPVGARALVVSNGSKSIAVEVVDQEGLFNVYADRIRALVAASGVHLDGIYISATHDESAPDSLGLGGVNQLTSGVNDFWVDYMVRQSALAIEHAYYAMVPAKIRYTEVLEPSNLRQCWSSYPFIDDEHVPVMQAVSAGKRPHVIATLASVSQHAETLGFNGGSPELDAERSWVSSDWVNFFRNALQRRFGGVAIEMAGAVGSVESPEVYPRVRAISRVPRQFIDGSHPAGCRTLFDVGHQTDSAGALHVPLGYQGETRAFGVDMAKPVIAALTGGTWYWSRSRAVWGSEQNICVPLGNELFSLAATLGVFAARPGYSAGCKHRAPVLPNGSTLGTALQSQVAAFGIGDGEFIAAPGEVFPFTFLRGFLGPQDMPVASDPLPPWPLPNMHARFRFIDGLAEDMLGYIFPAGNAVGIPTSLANLSPSDVDRFGCGHSDDSEAASAQAGNIVSGALVSLLDAHGGPAERVVVGRYVLPGGALSRDPLGGPEIKCTVDQTFRYAGRAVAVFVGGRRVRPRAWMSLSGLPQRRPDRDTRGYIDRRGRRVWLDVFPDLAGT
jgi:hypothetical protein